MDISSLLGAITLKHILHEQHLSSLFLGWRSSTFEAIFKEVHNLSTQFRHHYFGVGGPELLNRFEGGT